MLLAVCTSFAASSKRRLGQTQQFWAQKIIRNHQLGMAYHMACKAMRSSERIQMLRQARTAASHGLQLGRDHLPRLAQQPRQLARVPPILPHTAGPHTVGKTACPKKASPKPL